MNEADRHLYLLKIHQDWTQAAPGHYHQANMMHRLCPLSAPGTCYQHPTRPLHIHVEKFLKLKSLKPTPPAQFIPLPKELPPGGSTNKTPVLAAS